MKNFAKSRIQEMLLVAVVAAVIVTMIVPVAPWVLDMLIAVNLAIAVLIFTMALIIKNPIKFTVFPSLLLLATLYRLALNISSTRLILTHANAGRIIGGFGSFVVGNDIIVGGVIFSIITMVLFLVITKGAERVAEVSARFTLDAMPGLQTAIETDLKTKVLSPGELTARREELEQKSMYYGSLDGAMKFVRGDALAGLIITVINIAGGAVIGVVRHNMSITQALNTYGRLTVGDGLVSMLPALFISTAAGILVTRLGQGGNPRRLGTQIVEQLTAEPGALIASGALMLILAIVPGLPAWPFLLITGLIAILIIWMYRFSDNSVNTTDIDDSKTKSLSFVVGLDEINEQLEQLSKHHPVLIREAVYGRISQAYLAEIVGEMKLDGIDSTHLADILEALAREQITDDMDDLLIRLRMRISNTMHNIFVTDKTMVAWSIDQSSEEMLSDSLVKTARGREFALSSESIGQIIQSGQDALKQNKTVNIITRANIRRPLARLLGTQLSNIVVWSASELADLTTVQFTGTLYFE